MAFEPFQPLGPVNTEVPPSEGTYAPQTQVLPEVWMNWHNVSRGGTMFNRHLSDKYKEKRIPW